MKMHYVHEVQSGDPYHIVPCENLITAKKYIIMRQDMWLSRLLDEHPELWIATDIEYYQAKRDISDEDSLIMEFRKLLNQYVHYFNEIGLIDLDYQSVHIVAENDLKIPSYECDSGES